MSANSLDDTIITMRRTDNVDVTFVKERVRDKNILHEISSSANLAWKASCQIVFRASHYHYLSGRGKDQVLVIFSKAFIAFGGFENDFNYTVIHTTNDRWDVIPYPHVENGFVSKDFYKRWEYVAKEFWKKFERFEKQEIGKNYTFTGFGVGAVIAVFAALEYKMKYQSSPVNLITFGQPRIGNELFVHHTTEILSKAWRVTHGDDWVPNFPADGFHRVKQTTSSKSERPRRILFRHLPEEFWIEPISCDCPKPKIFLCYHTATLYENENCNARNHFNRATYPGINERDSLKMYRESHPDDEHLGPYFGRTMCPFPIKEKSEEKPKNKKTREREKDPITFKELFFGN